MKWKAWAPLAVAVVLGLLAAVTAKNMVGHKAVASKASSSQIVVAKHSILPGQALTEDDLATAPLAWGDLAEGTFNDKSQVLGRVTITAMVKGQPVLEGLLASSGAAGGLQALVPEGMRAITIEVNEFSGLAGLVTPGCNVDVVATFQEKMGPVAKTVVQNVKVMAVGQKVSAVAAKDAPKDGSADVMSKSVTLLTTLQEAEALELASMAGKPRLVLRGNGDSASAQISGVSMDQLGAWKDPSQADMLTPGKSVETKTTEAVKPVIASKPVVDTRTVKVIRAGVESVVTFAAGRPVANEPVAGVSTEPAIGH